MGKEYLPLPATQENPNKYWSVIVPLNLEN